MCPLHGSSSTTADVTLTARQSCWSPCAADELHVFSYLFRQIPQIQQKLIPFIDPQINQCSIHHTCLKHTVIDLCLDLAKNNQAIN